MRMKREERFELLNDYNERNEQSLDLYFNLYGKGLGRDTFVAHKKGKELNLNEQRQMELDILKLLNELGYPMDEIGTYLYKNVIIKVVENLNEGMEYENVLIGLINPYSQFYLDLARFDLDMGVKTFHTYITEAKNKIDNNKINENLKENILGISNQPLDNGVKSLLIASYVQNNLLNQQKNNKYTKVLKIV